MIKNHKNEHKMLLELKYEKTINRYAACGDFLLD